MSPISRSPIRAEESTQRQVTTEIRKGNRTSRPDGSSASYRSSRHAAVIDKLKIVVKSLELDATRERSLLGVFPGVLEGALSRFLADVMRREHRPGVTSSIRRGHFLDRDRGPSRAERELASQATVKARQLARDREYINRGE